MSEFKGVKETHYSVYWSETEDPKYIYCASDGSLWNVSDEKNPVAINELPDGDVEMTDEEDLDGADIRAARKVEMLVNAKQAYTVAHDLASGQDDE